VRFHRRHHVGKQFTRVRPILKFGSEEIKREYLVPMASGKKLGCFASRSRARAPTPVPRRRLRSGTAIPTFVNGTKNFITNAPQADTCVLFTMTDKAKAHKGSPRSSST